jgi:hypothetical protein
VEEAKNASRENDRALQVLPPPPGEEDWTPSPLRPTPLRACSPRHSGRPTPRRSRKSSMRRKGPRMPARTPATAPECFPSPTSTISSSTQVCHRCSLSDSEAVWQTRHVASVLKRFNDDDVAAVQAELQPDIAGPSAGAPSFLTRTMRRKSMVHSFAPAEPEVPAVNAIAPSVFV